MREHAGALRRAAGGARRGERCPPPGDNGSSMWEQCSAVRKTRVKETGRPETRRAARRARVLDCVRAVAHRALTPCVCAPAAHALHHASRCCARGARRLVLAAGRERLCLCAVAGARAGAASQRLPRAAGARGRPPAVMGSRGKEARRRRQTATPTRERVQRGPVAPPLRPALPAPPAGACTQRGSFCAGLRR